MRISLWVVAFLLLTVNVGWADDNNNNNLRKLFFSGSDDDGDSGSDSGSGSGSSDDCPEEDNFPDRIQYPYDPWLPVEDSDDPVQRLAIPSLSQPFYNNVIDVRATVSALDVTFILSTAGAWQFALRKLFNQVYFVNNPTVQESYLVTTSPPISVRQMQDGLVKVGNILYTHAEPHVAMGPQGLMNGLTAQGFVVGTPFPVYSNYGIVILKRKGDDRFHSFADLAHVEPGRFGTSGPSEGANALFRNTVKNIILNQPDIIGATAATAEAAANALIFQLFDEAGVVNIGPPMHHSVPHVLATGQADVGFMLLELAVMIMTQNPGVFEAIYLAKDKTGVTDNPAVLATGQDPLEGVPILTVLATRTSTPLSPVQDVAREGFFTALASAELDTILAESGLRRPV